MGGRTSSRPGGRDALVAGLPELEQRVLLLAPTARDAELSAATFAKAGLACTVCAGVDDLCREQERGAGALLLAESALRPDGVLQVARALRRQPAWSDLPILMLTRGGSADSPVAADIARALGNITLLEMPVRASTLLSAVGAALRARARQYEVRDQLAAQRRAEREIEAERAFLRRVIDTTPSLVFVKDWHGRFVLANEALARAYGTTVRDVVGRTDADFNPRSEEIEHFLRDDREVMSSRREKVIAEEEVTLAGGDVHWFSTVKVPLVDPDGTCDKVLGVASDITLRRAVEQALRAGEERYRALVTASSHVLYRMNPDWSEMREIQGGGLLQDTQHPSRDWIHDYIHPDDRAAVAEAVARSVRAGSVFELEHRVRRPDGRYAWVLSRAVPTRDAAGEIVEWFGAASDVTERRAAEEALREANRQLAEADRHKDQFLAMLAHELRNPLAPVRNAVHILSLVGGDPKALERQRELIDRQVTHMAHLLDDLLEVSRITAGKIHLKQQRVELATVLARAVETALPLIENRRHTLLQPEPAGRLEVHGDPDRLIQVVGNLLTNAAKYTPNGGRIWLEASCESAQAVIRVRDSGIGIAPEVLPRVFDVFMQAERGLERAQGGLGLGLSLVRSLVQLHGGSVEVRSAGLGLGSEFVVRLPALPDAGAAPARDRAEEVRQEVPPTRLRVLVVDDIPDSARSLAELLGLWGHSVRTAFKGSAALVVAREFNPDVVLLDIGMPDMDGYETARRLRDEPGAGKMTLVALTGYGQEEDRRRSREAGFERHLVKPVGPGPLRELLAQVPGGGQAPPASASEGSAR